ncbi:DUF1320 domain-containing protein, partial [Escherichia coli]|nr:DUF1320 domain-containing protein [Escherichia coli]
LADASAFIDGYLAARFVLPLTVVPSLLKRQCCVVAWFYLNESQPTEQITATYRDTVRWLEQVRDGKTDPGVESRTAASPDGENLVQVQSDAPVFSRKQKGFI